jgi:ABC-type Fe3+ transport system permease subunit
MIRLWLVFIVFAILIHFSITSWRALSGKEKWGLTKSIGYSIIVSLLAVLLMILIVIVF